jgi:aspartate/methionine/tyrosine aminotransferase
MIPGIAFSRRDSHFRVSYAATDEKLQQGVEILNRIARQ